MEKLIKLLMALVVLVVFASCAGQPVDGDDEFAADDESASALDSDAGGDSKSSKDQPDELGTDSTSAGDDLDSLDKDLDKEQKLSEGGEGTVDEDPLAQELKKDDITEDPQAKAEPPPMEEKAAPPSEPAPDIAAESNDSFLDVPQENPEPSIAEPTPEKAQPETAPPVEKSVARAEIKNIRFEGNENGGSIVIEADHPLEFSGRLNSQTNQYVLEIDGAHLPDRLKRPYITKDFQSSVGSIDAYQNPGSDSVRVVVQLRENASEPTTHVEGNSIVVVPGGVSGEQAKAVADASGSESFPMESSGSGILSSKNLEQFLSGNMKYYGKKISMEMRDISVRDAINLISEESGANLIMSEGVTGNLSIKLKNVPWDQALVLILKAKKLGYTKQGNVLRISPMAEIRQEEEDASKLVESRRKIEPLKVQMLPINYAKISDLQAQIKTVLTERGSIVADSRTNSLILTETEEVLERAKKIIASLDIAPAQVLIEGKLVEARESFDKRIGIQWDVSGATTALGEGGQGPINMTPSLSVRPGITRGSSLGFNLTLGTLDLLGDLNAILALEEREENVRVISSPRIVTLHNEEASIKQEAEVPYVSSSQEGKESKKTVSILKLSMDLKVTPEVANNGVVQLKVSMNRDFAGAVVDEAGTATKHSRNASTKVMVKSGQTAVIGGIYQNDTSTNDTGVPFLKDIPILGYLFKSGTFRKDKTELLLFLTPRVLSQAGSGVVAQDLGSSQNGNSQTE